jgi:SRSO17 transposase
MRVAQNIVAANSRLYEQGLLITTEKKTCTNMAESLSVSHDKIIRSLESNLGQEDSIVQEQIYIVQREIPEGKRFLLFDAMTVAKVHAEEIELLSTCHDATNNRRVVGLNHMNMMISNGDIKIPINIDIFATKKVLGNDYRSKTEVVESMIAPVRHLTIEMLLADAHFANQSIIKHLNQINLRYLMKIPHNRKVTIENQFSQLQEIFKLKKNRRFLVKKGLLGNQDCYFYVVKLDNETICYFVSSDLMDRDTFKSVYKIRWKIELFHRVAKQYLGVSQCQMRSVEKQRLHALFVMRAYTLELLIFFNNFFLDAISIIPFDKLG